MSNISWKYYRKYYSLSQINIKILLISTYKYPLGNKFSTFTLFANIFPNIFRGEIINFMNVNFLLLLLKNYLWARRLREKSKFPHKTSTNTFTAPLYYLYINTFSLHGKPNTVQSTMYKVHLIKQINFLTLSALFVAKYDTWL